MTKQSRRPKIGTPAQQRVCIAQQGKFALHMRHMDFQRLLRRCLPEKAKVTVACQKYIQCAVEAFVVNIVRTAATEVAARKQKTLRSTDLLGLRDRSMFVIVPEWIPHGTKTLPSRL